MLSKVRHFLRYLEHHTGTGQRTGGRPPAKPARIHVAQAGRTPRRRSRSR